MSVHKTKEGAAESYWQKMTEAGADKDVISFVSLQALAFEPEDDNQEGYNRMVAEIVKLAWLCGFRDAMEALERGSIKGLLPDDIEKHGNN